MSTGVYDASFRPFTSEINSSVFGTVLSPIRKWFPFPLSLSRDCVVECESDQSILSSTGRCWRETKGKESFAVEVGWSTCPVFGCIIDLWRVGVGGTRSRESDRGHIDQAPREPKNNVDVFVSRRFRQVLVRVGGGGRSPD